MTLMLDELRSVPVKELRAMLQENVREHEALRASGSAPGDEDFDQNTMFYVVLTAALKQRIIHA